MMTIWEELRGELHLGADDEQMVEFEKELIQTMVQIREQQGLIQAKFYLRYLSGKIKIKPDRLGKKEDGNGSGIVGGQFHHFK